MFESRVIEESGRRLTVENDEGDLFTFEFPTARVLDIRLAEPPILKSGSEPDGAAIWIADARPVATETTREQVWVPHAR